MLTVVALLNFVVYAVIAGVVTTEEVVRRKGVRNKMISGAQKKDIDVIEGYEKSKTKNKTAAMLKNQKKLNAKKFRFKLAKHILKAIKKKRFVFNRRYTISDLTAKNKKRVKELRKTAFHTAYADYAELKSEIDKSDKGSRKWAKRASVHREKALKIDSMYPKEQKNIAFYERTIKLPDGEDYVDHRTSINCHDTRVMEMFKAYVQERYDEPRHHKPTIIEMSFNGINKTSVTSPSEECLEYGKIMLMKEALEIAQSSNYADSVFPIKVMQADTKQGKQNEGRIRAVEIGKFENIKELQDAITTEQAVFKNRYFGKTNSTEK